MILTLSIASGGHAFSSSLSVEAEAGVSVTRRTKRHCFERTIGRRRDLRQTGTFQYRPYPAQTYVQRFARKGHQRKSLI
jgi:hypothetical protein